MPNLLTPPGLVGSHSYVDGRTGDPIALLHPMPSVMGAYIQTSIRGTRKGWCPKKLAEDLEFRKNGKLILTMSPEAC
jgi:hypothetical protein